jgi:hypothetical protein
MPAAATALSLRDAQVVRFAHDALCYGAGELEELASDLIAIDRPEALQVGEMLLALSARLERLVGRLGPLTLEAADVIEAHEPAPF